jgi:putative heme iron utilization protein
MRAFLEGERHGILATLSARRDGWPFASVPSYALTQSGDPLLLLSDLAEHTRNLRAEPRASLLVQDQTSLEDPQAGALVTLLGMVEAVASADLAIARAAYVARHPESAGYLAMGDFHLYVLHVREARFIGGFGDMGWMEGEALRASLCE